MNSQSLKAIFIIVLSALFAIYLGISAAQEDYAAVGWVVAALILTFILALGRSVWVLIPMGLIMVGTINALPGSPPAWMLATGVVQIVYVLRFFMRKTNFSFSFTWLDFVLLLQVLAVGQAFARAPAGVMFLGGDSAGGKSYVIFSTAFTSYFLLAMTNTDMKIIKRLVIAMIAICLVDGLIALGGDYSSSFGTAVLHVYSNSNLDVARAGDQAWDLSQSRGGQGFTILGKALVYPCFTLLRPLAALNPLRPYLPLAVGTGCVLVLLSGFRSNIGYLLATFIISALVRKKFADIAMVFIGSLVAVGVILVSGLSREMPFGVQRILSVLPVDVDSAARADAEDSTKWRTEMWVLALTTDRYIHDKVLGDGFGISSHEMAAKLNAEMGLGEFDIQDQMLATGSFHGFHVETIRFTGAFGLLCAIIAMFTYGAKALQLLAYYRGREEFSYLCYLLIPIIIYPWWSLLVFGSYRADFPQFLAMAGMLKMIDKMRLRELAAAPERAEDAPPAPTPSRFPGSPAYARLQQG